MLILKNKEDILNNPDKFVSAEIPPENDPILREYVLTHMIHGPCGNSSAPCWKDGKCSRGYPKSFKEETEIPEDGYPIYKRRNNGMQAKKKIAGGREVDIDNRWVVPYNPYLLKRFNCHINVEICSTVTAVKYMYKYIHKGSDRLAVGIADAGNNINEIQNYLDCRYISPPEACWRILGFGLHNHSHSVERQPTYLICKLFILMKIAHRMN
jgi:hypothetical protein